MVHYAKIGGVKYPLSYSLYCAKEISEKYGSVQKAYEILSKSKNDADKFDVFGNIAESLIKNGCAYCNELGIRYEGAPLDDHGNLIPISARKILLFASRSEIEQFVRVMRLVLEDDQKKKVHAVPANNGGKGKKKKKK